MKTRQQRKLSVKVTQDLRNHKTHVDNSATLPALWHSCEVAELKYHDLCEDFKTFAPFLESGLWNNGGT